MNTLSLTKKLISIPSYVDEDTNEQPLADFIYKYLRSNTKLIVKKNIVEGKRYNVVAYSKDCELPSGQLKINTLYIDHIDTVQPKVGWKKNQFIPWMEGNKLYGLGACDSKANVAVLMQLTKKVTNGQVMFLFYIDEEYEFKGVMAFVKTYSKKLTVKQIISADGEDLRLRIACRGILEFDVEVRGKTGHSANSKNGVNAITEFYTTIRDVDFYLQSLTDLKMGRPSLNVAYVRGGLLKEKKLDDMILGRNGNNIADFLEATIEIRTNPRFNTSRFIKWFISRASELKVKLRIKKIRFDLPPWTSKRNEWAEKLLNAFSIPIIYTDASVTGFVDVSFLCNSFSCTGFCIGVRGGNRHSVNEYVEINSINMLERLFSSLLEQEK